MEQGQNPAEALPASGGKKINLAMIAVIVIIIAITAGVLGYMFYKKTSKMDEDSVKETQKEQEMRAQTTKYDSSQYQQVQSQDQGQTGQVLPIQKEEAEEWQNYNNSMLGIEFEYPTGWFAYTNMNAPKMNIYEGDIYIQPTKEEEGSVPGPHANALHIAVVSFAGSLDEKTAVSYTINRNIKYSVEKTTIGGVEGFKASSVCDGVGCGNPEWFVANGGKLYKFYFGQGSSSEFNRIISTVKFIK